MWFDVDTKENEMLATVTTTTTTQIELSIDSAAAWFAGLTDDQQAQFLCKVAEIAEAWPAGSALSQWWNIGSHLRTCRCSTESGREMVRTMFEGLAHGTH